MQEIETKYSCDCCGTTLKKVDYRRNDGSFQTEFFDNGEHQICFSCLGKYVYVKERKELFENSQVLKKEIKKILKPLDNLHMENISLIDITTNKRQTNIFDFIS